MVTRTKPGVVEPTLQRRTVWTVQGMDGSAGEHLYSLLECGLCCASALGPGRRRMIRREHAGRWACPVDPLHRSTPRCHSTASHPWLAGPMGRSTGCRSRALHRPWGTRENSEQPVLRGPKRTSPAPSGATVYHIAAGSVGVNRTHCTHQSDSWSRRPPSQLPQGGPAPPPQTRGPEAMERGAQAGGDRRREREGQP
jgi:hypothetical protein